MRAENEPITLRKKACRPVVDRDKSHEPGYEVQRRNSESGQISTLLDRQTEKIVADCQAEIRKHEFQADCDRRSVQKLKFSSLNEVRLIVLLQETNNFNDINNFFMNNYWNKIENFVKLNEMEELKKFQSSTFDTIARRRFVEDQDTVLKLTGKIQDLKMKLIV